MCLFSVLFAVATLFSPLASGVSPDYPWSHQRPADTLVDSIPPPPGFRRIDLPSAGFGRWLRGLPLKPGNPRVMLHDGRPKRFQGAQFAVVDLDVGRKDLQQCADAVMRLRAEYLRARGRDRELVFNFTNGTPAPWTRWRSGERPRINGNQVSWRLRARPADDYVTFRKWLETVFIYAGSASLVREMKKVANPAMVQPGDVFIQGGFPGHAVLVLDVAVNPAGERRFLLGQSYMPAQDFHVLVQPENRQDPWYPAKSRGRLQTPEWAFEYGDLYRFPGASYQE